MEPYIDYPAEVDAPRGYEWGAHVSGRGWSGYHLIRKRDRAYMVARMRPDLSVVTRHRSPARPDELTRGELKLLVDDAFAKLTLWWNPAQPGVPIATAEADLPIRIVLLDGSKKSIRRPAGYFYGKLVDGRVVFAAVADWIAGSQKYLVYDLVGTSHWGNTRKAAIARAIAAEGASLASGAHDLGRGGGTPI